MLKRLIVELTEPLCDCPAGTQMALDMETTRKDGNYEFQVACTGCRTYISMPLKKLRALVKMTEEDIVPPPIFPSKRPKLVLLQGGASTSTTTKEAS